MKGKAKKKTNNQKKEQTIERMKYEIANEFGINLGPDSTARANGLVGGEITKRLVELGQNKSKSSTSHNRKKSK